MIYLINNVRQHERHFWNCLYSVATQEQIKRILDGHKVTKEVRKAHSFRCGMDSTK